MSAKRILVIAGSDSSGGAGLEADQKVIAAHGCYAMTATTALTAQNTMGVYGIHEVPSAFVKKQIEACIEDIGVDVVKTGMLASAETISTVARVLKEHNVAKIIVDPVMIATSGAQLLHQDAVQTLREELLPITTLLTPNIPEAQLLLHDAHHEQITIRTLDDMKRMAEAVRTLGSQYVLLKGGHLPFTKGHLVSTSEDEQDLVMDVLAGPDRVIVLESGFIKSRNTHGTGCSLASAIACGLAEGHDMQASVRAGTRYVEAGIRTSKDLGHGSGPINHFHSTYKLPFSPNHFVEYLLARDDVKGAWKEHVEHTFVAGLADGTLPLDSFKYYLIQDYLYLIQFSRANALAAYKAKNRQDMAMSASIIAHIETEMQLHIDYCKDFGLSQQDIESEEESQACTAYTRYVLDIGQSEDWYALQMALAPCLLGYGQIARRLYDDPNTLRSGNRYWKWIENYVGDDYVEAVRQGSEILERHAPAQSPNRIEELVQIFIHATRMETGFWDMGAGVRNKLK